MKQDTLLIELHYLPCIQYFAYLNTFEKVIIDPEDTYTKQTYRNRCRINGANKIEDLIIPVKKISNQKQLSSNVKIDYQQKWVSNHLRAIRSAYGKAPFFEFFVDDIFEIYNKKPERLFELNRNLLTKCLEILDLNVNIEYQKRLASTEEKCIYKAKNKVSPKKSGKKNHLFLPVEYFQVFGNNFVSNLSIIDLIFCEGPRAKLILEKSSALE